MLYFVAEQKHDIFLGFYDISTYDDPQEISLLYEQSRCLY